MEEATKIWAQVHTQNWVQWVEWVALLTNLAYVLLATRGDARCWFFGFLGTIATFWVSWQANLKSDATLQVYYAASAIYGWWAWRRRDEAGQPLAISSLNGYAHIGLLALGVLTAFPLGYVWHNADFRYSDALLATFSIITTFLTARKILENWLYWLVIDACYVSLYAQKSLILLAILSLVYAFFSVYGFFSWRKMMLKNTPTATV